MRSNSNRRSIVFVWENFGHLHADRCDAVANHFGERAKIVGIELYRVSSIYEWIPAVGKYFTKVTLFNHNRSWIAIFKFIKIFYHIMKLERPIIFFCHYEKIEIFLTAVFCRILGKKVFIMGDTKLDDRPRRAWKEVLKDFWFLPYHGALTQEGRSAKYLEFHGFEASKIATPYNAIDINRIREQSNSPIAPDGEKFRNRHFTIIGRLIKEKNISMAIEAYSIYVNRSESPRKLYICGSGPLKEDLSSQVNRLDLQDLVIFTGFLQPPEVYKVLAKTLAIILPSKSESFGFVVSEAQAMGLPVLLTTAVGALDSLVRNGSNGFVVEPDNPQGLAWYLLMLDEDEGLWINMCRTAQTTSSKSDVKHFARAVARLTDLSLHD